MSERSSWTRPLLWIVGAGVAVTALIALAGAFTGSIAIAEEPGRSINVPAVSVQPGVASTAPAAPPPTPDPTAEPTPEPTPASSPPELVPAPDPVIVDDHGGDRPDHDDDAKDDSSGSSGRGGSGSSDD